MEEDFEDQDALFEHLNASDTNRDGRSRQETFEDEPYAGELVSDKVSFNLENMSQIKQSTN